MFEDLDVDGDGKLSFSEYKLSAMKEPLIIDFLEHFLDEHDLSKQPRPPSRPPSVRSYRSNHSLAPNRRIPGSPSQHRLSLRLSQAELLEYSHQQQQQRLSVCSTSASSLHSLKTPNGGVPSSPGYNHPIQGSHRLSRGTSMASIDAAINSM
ncbi:hypothetical protein EC973_007117 [Apophysomyces ossiformis]|uniref:EF-hand domain-containing protein n=1 Tax=Apophysomyces ossiformis TaxID=679940 RepID=A0A8H7BZE8_9FUNG|nr:hypothetical protein EC973_007117 [Apophysomyces ossiformis]